MRREDWPEKLIAEVHGAHNRVFEWGVFDCWLFVADCVLAMTGIDYAKDLRGIYSSEREALTIINNNGGPDEMLVSMGFEKLPTPKLAQRGDIIMIEWSSTWDAVGICLGGNAAFASEKGIQFVKMEKWERAYKCHR